jgi:hypothetical protein
MCSKVGATAERADIYTDTLLSADRKVETERSVSGPRCGRRGQRPANIDKRRHGILGKVISYSQRLALSKVKFSSSSNRARVEMGDR